LSAFFLSRLSVYDGAGFKQGRITLAMKKRIGLFFTAAVALTFVAGQARAQQTVDSCERCQRVLDDIHGRLSAHCDQVSTREQLRQQPIYLFLSIFDEVSQGVPAPMRKQVYQAALQGMECQDPNSGVKAAQREANRLMVQSRT
jgi:hypothetical protein